MSKTNSFVKYLKNINSSINSQLERNLNRLKFDNLINLARSNKIILTFVALFILFITYLLLPTFYKQIDISRELKSRLLEKYNLEINVPKNLNYNFFPRPHFKTNNSSILIDNQEISKIKKLKIYVSWDNLFSPENLKIKDLEIENANFNLNNKNYDFFIKILENNFINRTLNIKNSNIFFRNFENDVLAINKIKNLKYYYDTNELKNILHSYNEIFNLPYEIKIFKNKNGILSELNLNLIKLKVINEISYFDNVNEGKADLFFNKHKSTFNYKTKKNFFELNFFDKLEEPKFTYKGKFNFKPFYSYINGKAKKINLSFFLDSNSLVSQLIKTEIFNNKNLDFRLNIIANKINNSNFVDLNFNSKIQEGLIDVDETKFKWKNIVELYLADSLIFVKDGELILDGKLSINILNIKETYKFLLTPKNYRKKIKKINFNFSYNFDQKTANIKDILIDNNFNQNVNNILSNVIFKTDKLRNRIYLRSLLNEAIKSYDG